MLLYNNRKEIHPLIKYIQHWQAYNILARKTWNYFLLKALGAVIFFIASIIIAEQLL